MNIWTLVSFIGFTALVALISWYYTRREDLKTDDGFFLGGRSLRGIPIAFSILLTNWSAEQLIGLNGQGYSVGLSNMGWAVTGGTAFVITACIFLPWFLRTGITTIPELLEQRFGTGIRNLTAWCILINMMTVGLPTVVYAGALAFNRIFDFPGLLGVSDFSGLVISVAGITIIGSFYAIFGGLKAVVVSDTINGIGFFAGSILILLLALSALGHGDIGDGVETLVLQQPQMMNAVSSPNVTVPFTAIFTGMLLMNVYFAGSNQVIIQRALGACSLAEGQKGVLLAGAIKIVSVLILVVPGIIAWHLYGEEGIKPDDAYPLLIKRLMPDVLSGTFGAIMFGAVISTFNSTINSCSTIFALNIWRPWVKRHGSSEQVILAGKYFGAAMAIFSACLAPFVERAPAGLYMFMQEFTSLFTIPMLLIILLGMLSRRATSAAAVGGLVTYVVLWLFFKFIWSGWTLNFLHKSAIFFICALAVSMIIIWIKPNTRPITLKVNTSFQLENWRYLRPASLAVVMLTVLAYLLASPFGLVAPATEIPGNMLRALLITLATGIGLNIFISLLQRLRCRIR